MRLLPKKHHPRVGTRKNLSRCFPRCLKRMPSEVAARVRGEAPKKLEPEDQDPWNEPDPEWAP